MTLMAHGAERFAHRHHHPVATALSVTLFWAVAAVLVATAHSMVDPISPKAGAALSIAGLIGTAWAYSLLVAREAGIDHALGVGIAWLVLSIATEVALTASIGTGWFALLGSPDRPLFRNVLLFVWIFAPALFARRGSE
jgi:hypothetical protein